MTISWINERDVNVETRTVQKSRVEVQDSSNISNQSTVSSDSFQRNNDSYVYSNKVVVDRNYYKAFQQSYGQFLVDQSTAIKEANDYQATDKEYRLLSLKSSMINEVVRQIGANVDLRLFIEAANRIHNTKTHLISSTNPITEAFTELRQGFLKLEDEIKAVSIAERNLNGIPTGNQIALSTVFASTQNFLRYINDQQVRNTLLQISDRVVEPKLTEVIAEKQKTASEEVKSLAVPVYKAMAGIVVPASVVGLAFSGVDYFGKNKTILKDAITTTVGLLKEEGATSSVVKELVKDSISVTHKTLSKGAASRLANRAMAHALLQTTTKGAGFWGRIGGLSVLGWRGAFGVGSRALGFLGGPIGLVASIVLPFAIELIIAETKDAFASAQGKEPKNQGWLQGTLPIGELFGSCFKDLGRSLS